MHTSWCISIQQTKMLHRHVFAMTRRRRWQWRWRWASLIFTFNYVLLRTIWQTAFLPRYNNSLFMQRLQTGKLLPRGFSHFHRLRPSEVIFGLNFSFLFLETNGICYLKLFTINHLRLWAIFKNCIILLLDMGSGFLFEAV